MTLITCPSCHSKKAKKTELSLECPDCLSLWYIGKGKEKKVRKIPIGAVVTAKSIGTNREYICVVRWSETDWFFPWTYSDKWPKKTTWQRVGWFDFLDMFEIVSRASCIKMSTIWDIRTAIIKKGADRRKAKKGGENRHRKHNKSPGDYVKK